MAVLESVISDVVDECADSEVSKGIDDEYLPLPVLVFQLPVVLVEELYFVLSLLKLEVPSDTVGPLLTVGLRDDDDALTLLLEALLLLELSDSPVLTVLVDVRTLEPVPLDDGLFAGGGGGKVTVDTLSMGAELELRAMPATPVLDDDSKGVFGFWLTYANGGDIVLFVLPAMLLVQTMN